jgi:mannan endo-1,4-beta-mannosidase
VSILTETRYHGHHRAVQARTSRTRRHRPRRSLALAIASTVALLVVAIGAGVVLVHGRPSRSAPRQAVLSTVLPTAPASYLGLFAPAAPQSYAGVDSFTGATGVRPNVVLYYSGWFEPFQATFAQAAAQHHAIPLVQIDPTNISLAAIAGGQFDSYLLTYAKAVRAYRLAVILSFGHEMNGSWYSWGYRHTAPGEFVIAWRHVVSVFRDAGATNVTWLWTANVFQHGRPSATNPAPWWPGRQYVTWVGIDGYYPRAVSLFSQLFGPTIAAVREFTRDPILISETGAVRAAGQPAKIAGLFAGIRTYQLLGFIWFDANADQDYRITSPAAFAAFRRAARTYRNPVG